MIQPGSCQHIWDLSCGNQPPASPTASGKCQYWCVPQVYGPMKHYPIREHHYCYSMYLISTYSCCYFIYLIKGDIKEEWPNDIVVLLCLFNISLSSGYEPLVIFSEGFKRAWRRRLPLVWIVWCRSMPLKNGSCCCAVCDAKSLVLREKSQPFLRRLPWQIVG